MKKLYQKTCIILVSIILANVLLSNVVLAKQADDPFLSETETDHSQILTPEIADKYGETGEAEGSLYKNRVVDKGDDTKTIVTISQANDRDTNLKSEQSGFISSMFAGIIKTLASAFQAIITAFVGADIRISTMFTIENLLTGKYELFDINIFDKDVQSASASEISKKIKTSVAEWYGTIRIIAIIASLLVLLYIGIRMAMSTTVTDRVRYKKMLVSWFTGFALIFVLHYIVLILITLSDQFVKVLASIAPTTATPFEYAVLNRVFSAETTGDNVLLEAILYAMLVWYQVKFFFIYLKRVLSNAFLILISPLVTVTYAIDKANDCKAQAFNSWLEEIITNIFIQPMHLLLFLVLLYSAGEIAELYPIVAILFMFGIGKGESILRGLFKLRGSTIQGVEEGQSFTGLVNKL